MRRGQVWLVELDPSRGHEANKTRMVVIVSSDASNDVVHRLQRGVVTVVPLTSASKPAYDFQAAIPAEPGNGLEVNSIAQAEQIRAVDFSRFVRPLGTLRDEHCAAIDDAIITHLDL